MCKLETVSIREKVEGYKIVARKSKGKRYYSIAMGFKYPLDGHIPVIRKQSKICYIFMDDIISEMSSAHEKDMTGRTIVYLRYSAALARYRVLMQRGSRSGYILVIVRAEVSEDVMEGFYGGYRVLRHEVAAGRHIRFIEEIDVTSREE